MGPVSLYCPKTEGSRFLLLYGGHTRFGGSYYDGKTKLIIRGFPKKTSPSVLSHCWLAHSLIGLEAFFFQTLFY